jgi:pimeloyl-ACP methyl ester carboxylesterase
VRPLILVHGLAGAPRWWASVLPALREYDVRHADPRKPFDVPPDAILAGHSLGGLRAAQVAATTPVHALVLVAPAGIPTGRPLVVELLATVTATTPRFVPLVAFDALRWGPLALLRHGVIASRTRADLTQINAPTLLVWGERDTLVPTRLAAEWHAAIPGSRLAIIPGAKHVPMFETPSAFVDVLLEFLHELGD